MDCNGVSLRYNIGLGRLELLKKGLQGLDIGFIISIAEFKLLSHEATHTRLEILLNSSEELIVGGIAYLFGLSRLICMSGLAERGLEHFGFKDSLGLGLLVEAYYKKGWLTLFKFFFLFFALVLLYYF